MFSAGKKVDEFAPTAAPAPALAPTAAQSKCKQPTK